jgi:uncharacterized protein YceK
MRRLLAIAISAFALTGCGTVENFTQTEPDGRRPLEVYGGVTRSVATVKEQFASDLVVVPFAPLYIPDVLLSVIGDTLTLPVTIPASVVYAINDGINDYYFPKDQPQNARREFGFENQQNETSSQPARNDPIE